MNWSGAKKKQFREALQKVYPDPVDLEMFVDEDFGGNKAEIWEGENLQQIAYCLIKKTEAKGSLDQLYEVFCQVNANNLAVKELQGDCFIDIDQSQQNIMPEQWQQIFSVFHSEDIFALDYACDAAFIDVFGKPLSIVYPDTPPLNTLKAISDLLSKYDQINLTKAFIRHAVKTIKERDSSRDFSPLGQWYEPQESGTISQKQKPNCGYILVSLKLYAKSITVFAELHLKGGTPEPLDKNSEERGIVYKLHGIKTDEIPNWIAEQLAEPLSKWVQQAERQLLENKTLKIDRQTVIEIFLQWQLLDARVDEWDAIDDLQEPCKLREHRGFIVRSLDRVTSSGLQLQLRQSWQTLEKSSEIDRTLVELLPEGLPEDLETRQENLKELVKSPVLIAFWTHDPQFDRKTTLAAFEQLLKRENLIEFANLAEEIKRQRQLICPISNLGMLCDCPHRLPTIPTNKKPVTTPS